MAQGKGGGTNNRPRREREKQRNIRIADDLWHAAQEEAAERGEYVSEVVRRSLRRYTAKRRQG